MPPAKRLGWKIASFGAGALATFVTRRALAAVWGRVGDDPPPDDLADRSVSWKRAVGWAVATGVGVGVSRLVAMRGAATAWEVATNEPPPGHGAAA